MNHDKPPLEELIERTKRVQKDRAAGEPVGSTLTDRIMAKRREESKTMSIRVIERCSFAGASLAIVVAALIHFIPTTQPESNSVGDLWLEMTPEDL